MENSKAGTKLLFLICSLIRLGNCFYVFFKCSCTFINILSYTEYLNFSMRSCKVLAMIRGKPKKQLVKLVYILLLL